MNTLQKYKIPQVGALSLTATACLGVGVTGDWEASDFGGNDYPFSDEYTTEAGDEVYTYRGISMSLNADATASLTVNYTLSYNGEAENYTYSYSGTYTSADTYNINLSGDSVDLEFQCTLQADDTLGCDAFAGDEEIIGGATFIRSAPKN